MKAERATRGIVRLFHWRTEEAAGLIATLRDAGYGVIHHSSGRGLSVREIADSRTSAIVIDLSRMPSHGRNIGAYMRGAKSTRHIPLVFVDGDPAKVAAIQQEIPDAIYVSSTRVVGALKRAKPPHGPVVPPRLFETNRTTAQKLGVRNAMTVGLIDPPADYARVLGELPDGAVLEEDPSAACALTLWFIRDPGEFAATLSARRKVAAKTPLWIVWKKGRKDGLNGNFVRAAALKMGLVDYKICSLDATWSGMLFAVKKAKPR
jgi:hypothetical protein